MTNIHLWPSSNAFQTHWIIKIFLFQLDENDNPPKSEWTFQVLKSDRSGGKGQMIVIRKNKDKYETKVIDLTIFSMVYLQERLSLQVTLGAPFFSKISSQTQDR